MFLFFVDTVPCAGPSIGRKSVSPTGGSRCTESIRPSSAWYSTSGECFHCATVPKQKCWLGINIWKHWTHLAKTVDNQYLNLVYECTKDIVPSLPGSIWRRLTLRTLLTGAPSGNKWNLRRMLQSGLMSNMTDLFQRWHLYCAMFLEHRLKLVAICTRCRHQPFIFNIWDRSHIAEPLFKYTKSPTSNSSWTCEAAILSTDSTHMIHSNIPLSSSTKSLLDQLVTIQILLVFLCGVLSLQWLTWRWNIRDSIIYELYVLALKMAVDADRA